MFRFHLLNDPLEQFKLWYNEAVCSETFHSDAIMLATANLKGEPSVRTVLYKGISEGGFLFFTNYYSRKAQELSKNPKAAWVFYWPKIYKQVRGEGYVERLTREESKTYFETRSYKSQIVAWVSEQSQEIPSRKYLLKRYKKYQEKFHHKVSCPEFWGGFRLIPSQMEFWIGQEHRLHERFCYLKKEDQVWKIVRLAP